MAMVQAHIYLYDKKNNQNKAGPIAMVRSIAVVKSVVIVMKQYGFYYTIIR
jgi:hypothetical protein